MHIIGHSFASLVHLVSGDKTTWQWVIFLKFVITSSLIITEDRSNGQILRSGIEDDSSGLTAWGTHEDCTEINGIVFALKGYLELKIILVVFWEISDFTHQLGNFGSSMDINPALLATFLDHCVFSWFRCLDHVIISNWLWLLGQVHWTCLF